jgi:uncharacterized protein
VIIDSHAYVGHWPFRRLSGTDMNSLIQRLDAHHVDAAVVTNVHGIFYKNVHKANEELFGSASNFSDRIKTMGIINPTYPMWKSDLKQCFEDYGVSGIRLFPDYHDYTLQDPRVIECLNTIGEYGGIAGLTCQLTDRRQRSWLDPGRRYSFMDFAGVIKKAPGTKFVIYHAIDESNDRDEALQIFRDNRVYLDTVYGTASGIIGPSEMDFDVLMRGVGGDRLLFGSATPFRDYSSSLLRVALLMELDSENAARALWKNAKHLFEI